MCVHAYVSIIPAYTIYWQMHASFNIDGFAKIKTIESSACGIVFDSIIISFISLKIVYRLNATRRKYKVGLPGDR